MNIQQKLLNKCQQILKEHCEIQVDQIHSKLRLQEDLGLDSLGLLSLAVELENDYQINLDEDANQPPKTIGEIIDLVYQRLQEANRLQEVL